MRRLSYAAMVLLWCACGDDHPRVAAIESDASVGAAASNSSSPACEWPTPTESCTPRAGFLSCLVKEGEFVEADGAVVDASGKPVPGACMNLCKSTEYALTCGGNDPATPSFADSLACRIIPSPTPSGVTLWCCPCGG